MGETALAPNTATAVQPAPPASPATGSTALQPRRAGNAVAQNLAVESVLDVIRARMTQLSAVLEIAEEAQQVLDQTARVLDSVIVNVDEAGKQRGAPAATRAATDADAEVVLVITELTQAMRQYTQLAAELNRQAYLSLNRMVDIQESQRSMGAGPDLLARSRD